MTQPTAATRPSAADTTEAIARLTRGRTRLLADPNGREFGALAMHLALTPRTDVHTAATDGTHFFYNPAAILSLSDPELMWLWAHEACHPALGHNWRIPAFLAGDWHEWNVCTDLAINLLIEHIGQPISGRLYDAAYVGKAAEEIARLRKRERDSQQTQPQPQPQPEQGEQGEQEESDDTAGDDGSQDDAGDSTDSTDGTQDGTGDPSGTPTPNVGGTPGDEQTGAPGTEAAGGTLPGGHNLQPGDDLIPAPPAGEQGQGTPTEPTLTETDWQTAVEMTSAVSRKAGVMPGDLDRAVQDTRASVTDWRSILREFVETQAPVDYTWQRPNRRYAGYAAQGIILPGTLRENLPPVVLFTDTSGSVSDDELRAFGDNATTILDECKPRELIVVYVDTQVRHVQRFVPGDVVTLEARGGGGTAFQPAFDWLAQAVDEGEIEAPACAIYLTDGHAWDLDELTEPACPVMFAIISGGRTDMPFGKVVDVTI